jgi:carbonic anhydrase
MLWSSLRWLPAAVLFALPHALAAKDPQPAPLSPDAAWSELARGNQRFLAGKVRHPHADRKRLLETADKGQHPIAVVLSCSDSRVPPEIFFDQGIGDIFSVRVAGNVSNNDEIASIEYAAEHLHVPLAVVLGHTQCGAVTAVVERQRMQESLHRLTLHIQEAVEQAHKAHPQAKGEELLHDCIRENVLESMADLLKGSEIVRHLVGAGHLKLVGAIYNIRTGRVVWIGEHPEQRNLLGSGASQHRP